MYEQDLSLIVVTHDGKQHADEILAAAFLKMRFGNVRFVRSSDPVDMERADILLDCGAVYDPGRARFDHHGIAQQELPWDDRRAAGFATAGLVWRAYGVAIVQQILAGYYGTAWAKFYEAKGAPLLDHLGPLIADRLDREIICPVDAWDNGHYPPPDMSRKWLPLQWLIPHLSFDIAVEAMGKAFMMRLRTLADMAAHEWQLNRDLRANGPSEFYLAGNGVMVVAPAGERIEVSAARRVVQENCGLPLAGVISSLRQGTRWVALMAESVPDHYPVPADVEFTRGRKSFYHDDPAVLLAFVMSTFPQED